MECKWKERIPTAEEITENDLRWYYEKSPYKRKLFTLETYRNSNNRTIYKIRNEVAARDGNAAAIAYLLREQQIQREKDQTTERINKRKETANSSNPEKSQRYKLFRERKRSDPVAYAQYKERQNALQKARRQARKKLAQ